MAINRNKLKTYAPKARRDFIAAVTARAAKFGLSKDGVEPMEIKGDVALIGGQAHPAKVGQQRRKLEARINLRGFEHVMEEAAYTWFNRFAAIRFMELHGYLDHGYRVLSHPNGKVTPEIVEHAEHVDLPGLDRDKVIELKLDGTKDEALYRILLRAQCNALHAAMPFLFEKIDDETELLLPDNLLHSDSLIRQMVAATPEANWREIEIVGWLYQFYISEKKDQVIGKVVKSEDIPAATQLFTPNWIVKYMVQNSLGAQWLATYPDSGIKATMDYYFAPAEQTGQVQAKLAEITPKSLNPEEITLLDPACGSGHILVEAYELFREIYLERGYRLRDIPRLILEKNLYGLDIDDRAAQLAGFALLMKARADDRRILDPANPPKMNVMAIQSSAGLDAKEIARHLIPEGHYELVPSEDLLPDTLAQPTLAAAVKSEVKEGTIRSLLNLFEDAKTFGSLITVPENIQAALPALEQLLKTGPADELPAEAHIRRSHAGQFKPLVTQAGMLSRPYDCVVANPPYFGPSAISLLKKFIQFNFPDSKSDLFAAFIDRNLAFSAARGSVAMITMQSWMFLSSYEKLRENILSCETITSMAHFGPRAFDSIGGEVVSTTAFVIKNSCLPDFCGTYFRLLEGGNETQKIADFRLALSQINSGNRFTASVSQIKKIPGCPIAYWVSEAGYNAFSGPLISSIGKTRRGLQTGNKDEFIRCWHECPIDRAELQPLNRKDASLSPKTWFMFNNGGSFRKWYGNLDLLVNWASDGSDIKNTGRAIIPSEELYFRAAVCWSRLSSDDNAVRIHPQGVIPGDLSPCFYTENMHLSLAYLNSAAANYFLNIINPTITKTVGDMGRIPGISPALDANEVTENTVKLVQAHKTDWDDYQTSWDFAQLPLLQPDHHEQSLARTYDNLCVHWEVRTEEVRRLEEKNNRLIIDAYGLADELTPEVPRDEITLTCNPHYRYGSGLSDAEREERLRADTMRELISYSIGCMMGRYSLAEPGLIYARSGNEDIDPSRYGDFPADDDGIIPVTDTDWFADDAANRFAEFLKFAWSPATLKGNLQFVADSLGGKSGETALDTVRRYLSRDFFKDHLKTYKKRPIYWLFSSGKEKAFECLVYLHRYNEGTLSRMRMEYVTPLQGRMAARIDQLNGDIEAASSTAERNRKQKEKDKLVRHLEELRKFDEDLRHYADMRITLDLDDGVKVNYGKFGNLLAERKAVTGEK